MRIFKKKKTEMEKFFDRFYETFFPGGKKQIDDETNTIIKLSNNKLSFAQAQSLLLRSKAKLALNKRSVFSSVEKYSMGLLNNEEIKNIVGFIVFGHVDKEFATKMVDLIFGAHNMGYSDDEIPVGYGEFGRCLTNPIPTKGIAGSEEYLEKLKTENGKNIKWERVDSKGSVVEKIDGAVDIYKIVSEDGDDLGELYLSPYNQKTSNKSPVGFVIEGGIRVNSDEDLQAKVNRAREYKESGKLIEALGIYNQVFDFLCQEAASLSRKGNILDHNETRVILPNYFDEAKKYLKQNDAVCKILNNMGTILAELGDYEGAKSMFKQAIDLTPEGMDYPDPKIGLKELEDI